ncbi:hypothetical protein SMC26_08415 [Actinomadura fulvescens]|uniref:Epoxide hydrolase n=1 Tax=Actinomadura fulvescens TaxID=46160 RepID=A0ABN3QUA7_9ACTN
MTGGSGSPVVLLHGWPQTWFGWWQVMPALGIRDARVVGHDLGAAVAFQYAAQFPADAALA